MMQMSCFEERERKMELTYKEYFDLLCSDQGNTYNKLKNFKTKCPELYAKYREMALKEKAKQTNRKDYWNN